MKVEALTRVWDGLYRGESVVFAHKDNIIMVAIYFEMGSKLPWNRSQSRAQY